MPGICSNPSLNRNLGLAGRFTYAYASRYFTELNFGYNGSERFSKKERFGFFPSIGLGWIVSNENFWGDRLKETINMLKFKATYGFVWKRWDWKPYRPLFSIYRMLIWIMTKRGLLLVRTGTVGERFLSGISISRYSNDLISWETAEKTNLGIELGLWEKNHTSSRCV